MQEIRGFKEEELTAQHVRALRNLARQVRGDTLRMTQLSGSGPVGGSLSVVETLVTLACAAEINPSDPDDKERDRIVLAHEHAAAPFYATLGRLDFFDLDDAVSLFRKAGSIFEGCLERSVPGVEWSSGTPGQGLAVSCGLSLAARWNGLKPNIFVIMSDEEQQCGHVAEARRFAKKYRLNNITAVIDTNNMQSVGKTSEIMPQNIKYEYIADGWDVIEINGHDPAELYQAVRRASQIQSTPVLVLANTTMGYGVSFIENQQEYYARALSVAEYKEAMRELGGDHDLTEAASYRSSFGDFEMDFEEEGEQWCEINTGAPRTYGVKDRLNNVEAFGNTLADIAGAGGDKECPMVVFDCANANTMALGPFMQKNHDKFIQAGLGHHAAATIAASMSAENVLAILVDFGINSIEEVYHQLKLADVNRTNVKIVATRLGLDAGSDGKAAHCLDYMGLAANLLGFKMILPADPNQTDRALRYMAEQPGNWIMGLGRSETPVINNLDGKPIFGGDYQFEYGHVTEVRPGKGGVIITTGQMLSRAIEAWSVLNREDNAPTLIHVSSPLALDRDDDPVLLAALRSGRVVTYEDHNKYTGLGSRVANVIALKGVSCRLLTLGVNRYSYSGDADDLYRMMGLDVETLVAKTRKFLKR